MAVGQSLAIATFWFLQNRQSIELPVYVSRLALPVILVAVFVVPIGISGTAVAIPHIADDLGSNPVPLQWVVNGFNGSFALFTIVWGVLTDRLGGRVTFVIGLAVMVAGSAPSAMAPSLLVLDIARVVAGVGGAAIFCGAASTMANAFPRERRARNFMLFGTTLGLVGRSGRRSPVC